MRPYLLGLQNWDAPDQHGTTNMISLDTSLQIFFIVPVLSCIGILVKIIKN
jgi:hypothetical protein